MAKRKRRLTAFANVPPSPVAVATPTAAAAASPPGPGPAASPTTPQQQAQPGVFPYAACMTKMQMAGYNPLQAGQICTALKKKYMLQQGMM